MPAVAKPCWFGTSTRRAFIRFPAVAAFVLGTSACVCSSQEMPVDLSHLRERAEEHYFDGDYESAIRVLADAEKWLDSPLNKRDVARFGFDHSLLDACFSGFRAEVLFAKGEQRKAMGALRHAEKTLKNRRSRFVANGLLPPMLWQYEAFLEFVRGDLLQPIPDFGLTDDPNMPAEVQQFFRSRGSASDAIASYSRAEKVLGDPRAVDAGGFFRRLEGRLLTSLARCKLLKAGKLNQSDIVDCEALLERAEAAFGRGDFWQRVIKQAGIDRLPLTFKEVNQQAADPAMRLALKRMFAQTISDWLEIQLLRAELTAYQEQEGEAADDDGNAISTAEQTYDQIVGFMKSQFGANHATVQRVQLSRARWLVALARSPDHEAPARFSWLQDCLSDLGGITKVSSGDSIQVRTIELAALSMMLDLDRQIGRLGPEEKQKYVTRVEELKGAGFLGGTEERP